VYYYYNINACGTVEEEEFEKNEFKCIMVQHNSI
jgi:hypothetical protein